LILRLKADDHPLVLRDQAAGVLPLIEYQAGAPERWLGVHKSTDISRLIGAYWLRQQQQVNLEALCFEMF
jgi:hypothetical protein